jgi:hypothetical protein
VATDLKKMPGTSEGSFRSGKSFSSLSFTEVTRPFVALPLSQKSDQIRTGLPEIDSSRHRV